MFQTVLYKGGCIQIAYYPSTKKEVIHASIALAGNGDIREKLNCKNIRAAKLWITKQIS